MLPGRGPFYLSLFLYICYYFLITFNLFNFNRFNIHFLIDFICRKIYINKEMKKEELRDTYKLIRKKILNKKEKSIAITKNVLSRKEIIDAKVIGLYSNLADEVDTIELTKILLKLGKKVAFPKTYKEKIEFYETFDIEDLCEVGAFGIKEPKDSNPIDAKTMDVIIVPGICFDMNKNRLGFGAGYYDRFLEKTSALKIGICFEEQILKEDFIETTPNDIKMDLIISETEIF